MMIQNNVFPVEGPQSAHGPISEEITCSTARLKISSMCNAELLLNNCPSAMYSTVGWEHCFFRIRAWLTTDMTWWFSVTALGHEHSNALCIFFDVPSFQSNLGYGALSLRRKQLRNCFWSDITGRDGGCPPYAPIIKLSGIQYNDTKVNIYKNKWL